MTKEKSFKEEGVDNEEIRMGFFNIISDKRTNFFTKVGRLLDLMLDLIFILLFGFSILFFYLNSQVGWIFLFLSAIRYITKK